MEKRSSAHIAGLDLIRLTAALFVVFDHFTSQGRNTWVIDAIGGGLPSYPVLSPVTDAGWIGVDIFFVISGLVIAYTANGNSPRRFAEARFFRLMPSVWIASNSLSTRFDHCLDDALGLGIRGLPAIRHSLAERPMG